MDEKKTESKDGVRNYMSTNENANQILEETISVNPQLTEMPEKTPETSLWARIKANKKYIFAGIGIVALAGVAYGIGIKKLTVGAPQLHEEAVSRLPKKIVEAVPVVQIEPKVLESVTSTRPYTRPTEPVAVVGHIRELTGGKCHTPEQAAKAAAAGIYNLKINETYVSPHTKYAA